MRPTKDGPAAAGTATRPVEHPLHSAKNEEGIALFTRPRTDDATGRYRPTPSERDTDPLAPARGLAIGVALSLAMVAGIVCVWLAAGFLIAHLTWWLIVAVLAVLFLVCAREVNR